MTKTRWLFWPLFAALMGFVFGGSFVWGIDHPNHQQHIDNPNSGADAAGEKNKPPKTFGESLSIIWDRTWDDPVAFYTFILAIFTALLATVSGVQIFFLIRADKTARISAEAGNLSAQASINAQLPIFAIKSASLAFTAPDGNRLGYVAPGSDFPAPHVNPIILVQNLGRLPAEVIQGCVELIVAYDLPPKPIYKNIQPYAPGMMVSFEGQIPVEPTQYFARLTDDQLADIPRKRQRLWVYGFLGYKDFMGNSHTYPFCFKWAAHPDRPHDPVGFVYDDDAPAEYTRRD